MKRNAIAGDLAERLAVPGEALGELCVQAMTKKEMLICGTLQAIEWD